VLVLVTGGTGFVGSHAVARFVAAGHQVRVLARDPSKVAAVLAPHGLSPEGVRTASSESTTRYAHVQVARGDMTDPEAVGAALEGCDAVVHAAAEVGVAGGTGPTGGGNVEGVRQVVGQAVERGLDPILYTSTITAYLPTDRDVVDLSTPLAEPQSAYGRAKQEAEVLVRGWQAQGAPIATFVIGGVYGPISPHFDGSFAALQSAVEMLMGVTDGGLGVVDVRDLASLLTAALESGRGPRRYLAGGRYVTWGEWTDCLSEAIGREVPKHAMTADDMLAMGRDLDARRAAGEQVDMPLSEEAAVIMAAGVPTDDAPTLSDLGVAYRPIVETFADAVAWLVEQGRLDPALVPAVRS